MMLALSELLCYAAIAVVLDRKYRRNARKIREWTKKWLLKRQLLTVRLKLKVKLHVCGGPKQWSLVCPRRGPQPRREFR